MSTDHIQVFYDARGMVMIELGGHGLEMTREEAEALFVSIGHALQDMDMANQEVEDD